MRGWRTPRPDWSVIRGASVALRQVLAPRVTDDPELVAGYLGTANGLGFAAGALLGHLLLRRSLRPPGGRLFDPAVVRTMIVAVALGRLAWNWLREQREGVQGSSA